MTTPLWTMAELAALPGARLVGPVAPASGVSIDTRTLQPGDLFVAIRGDARDGHDFVEAAIAKGAAAAIVAEDRAGAFPGPLVAVPDPLDGLRDMGRAARARANAGIVAVTGSDGKTGTKEALNLVLSRFGASHASA
ncbi:MAG: UDP-N-acetylmuramoylalanyl-D-glutamyl-2, 6-diaminopimelate--D-alanyl-D-alanine ligase, partial [Methylobacteriaceae bacterium]|nr:UDP-N-acetylmuramoylalanyl-D-glutamyl-2, 6-diaminopimelate--D-alanyl-D-alanine ligase [Methylobacteriaceae bacterium]